MSRPSFLIALSLLIGVLSCRRSAPPEDLFPDAQTIQLKGSEVTLKLPADFVPTSPAQLTGDFPAMAGDTSFLKLTATFFSRFGAQDPTLDVLVDTTSEFRCLIMAAGPGFEMDEAMGKRLNQELGDYFRGVEEDDLFLDIHKMDAAFKGNDQVKFFKYKQEVVRTNNRASYYQSLYMLRIQEWSLLMIEFSVDGDDVEEYLWSVKGSEF